MKKFKEVLVYTGYNENDIEDVQTFEATDLLKAITVVENAQIDQMAEDWNEDYYNEFFGEGRPSSSEGVGVVNAGEENVILVFDENNKWFGLVDSFETWTEELCEEWCKFLNEESF